MTKPTQAAVAAAAIRRGHFALHDGRGGQGGKGGQARKARAGRVGETIERLAAWPGGARVERIVSRGEASPPGFWYDQDQDEWVLLAAGRATVAFEGRRVRLRPGDWLLIPARCRHRVASASEDAVWLAVFPGAAGPPA